MGKGKVSLYCPKCGQEYRCPCGSCNGKGWAFIEDGKREMEKCLQCGLTMSIDWWFDLECDIYRDDMKTYAKT
jgi:hypothetical protein